MRYKILFLLIFLIATVARFYKLGSIPNGLTWDEAAIGYNAYGLVTNHRDEWLHRTPIVFQSFGDYKSPLLVYVTAGSVALFKLTPFAIRLPVALAGVLMVLIGYLLAKEITSSKRIALFVMLLLALSPWAIVYSRVGFEATLAAVFIATGVYFLLRWRRTFTVWDLLASMGSLSLSLYAYHSPKVVVPLVAVIFGILLRKELQKNWRTIAIAGTCFTLSLLPLAYASIFGNANSRALGTTILQSPNILRTFTSNLITQLSPGFLLHGKDLNYRQGTGVMGVSTPVELLLAIIGILFVVKVKSLRKFWWIVSLFGIGVVPAALGIDVPHSIRSLNSLPWLQILAGIGAMGIFELLLSSSRRQRSVPASGIQSMISRYWIPVFTGMTVLILIINFIYFAKTYEQVYSSTAALADFGYGYEEAITYAKSKESEVSKVYFTNHYGQAYIYLLFFKRLTPIEYQGGGLANYVITDRPFAQAQGQTPVLIIGTPDEVPATQNVVKEIKYPDGTVVFRIVRQ